MRQTLFRRILVIAAGAFFLNSLLLFNAKASNPRRNLRPERSSAVIPIEPEIRKVIQNSPSTDVVLPVVVFGCNRPRALQKHIEGLLAIRKNAELHPILVSLDCHDSPTLETAKTFKTQIKTIIELPDLGALNVPSSHSQFTGYYRIARHYGYSLNYVLNVLNYEAMIITEDDLEISPDFLDYFRALYSLLKNDKTLYCISAWNDNGLDQKIEKDPTLLHRSDFFPGLGWLLTKTVWNEIKNDWPKTFWDDWMRKPEQRRDRACIRPEVSRTMISIEGKRGVSGGQFYDDYLKKIIKNDQIVDWLSMDLSYLEKKRYDEEFQSRIDRCPVITISDLNEKNLTMNCAQIPYSKNKEFVAIAHVLQLMNDFKSGVPRTAYRGVVQSRYGKTRIYIVPKQKPWLKYEMEPEN